MFEEQDNREALCKGEIRGSINLTGGHSVDVFGLIHL